MADLSTDRARARLDWTRRVLDDPTLTLAAATNDASFRSYWRIMHTGRRLIVMDAPPPAEDVRPWLDIGQRLAAVGVHVPAVHASDVEQGFVLIEDFGNRLYLPELDTHSVDHLYGEAMQTLLTMQTHVDTDGLPAYDAAFLRREMELLTPWFLEGHLGCTLDAAARRMLAAAFDQLVNNAITQPQCFVHRDFHSRNLMITDGANPGVIDFQGALRGPITYDLASLLRDCYIAWDHSCVTGWTRRYRRMLVGAGLLPAAVGPDHFQRWVDLTGLQRHIKVLGLFCRLAYRDGKTAYLADLPRVLDYVLGVATRYPELSGFAALLRESTVDRDLTHPRAVGATSCAP